MKNSDEPKPKGRPVKDIRKVAICMKFGLSYQNSILRSARLIDQLDQCKDNASRRIILGISK